MSLWWLILCTVSPNYSIYPGLRDRSILQIYLHATVDLYSHLRSISSGVFPHLLQLTLTCLYMVVLLIQSKLVMVSGMFPILGKVDVV